MIKIFLSLDPAISCGYCLVSIVPKISADIFAYDTIQVDTSSEYEGDWCISLMDGIEKLIHDHHVEGILTEAFFFSRKFATGSSVNASLRAAIYILARRHSIPYWIVNISSWKRCVAGRSTPTREDKKKWGAACAKKLFIQQALWTEYGFRFPNHTISPKTKKPILFKSDMVDAVGIAVFYCQEHERIKPTLSVVPAQDVVFKKKSKKTFEYPST